MSKALLGYTGFVGGNLKNQTEFTDFYNSQNTTEIEGKSFDLIVSAAAPAEKWRANKEPEKDLANLENLMDHLKKVKAKEFILISTVDVYPNPRDVDETSPINPKEGNAYGRHRYLLEEFCRERFSTLTVRLPGLFGTGLKKNAVYDLLHDNNLDQIDADSVYQFYCLNHLWDDIEIARKSGFKLVNFATEPTSIREIAREGFGLDFNNKVAGREPAYYDFHSIHAERYGGSGGYLYGKEAVLADLKNFVSRERGR